MLKLENICYEADGKEILKDISLELEKGMTVVTGPNGSGKSTLAKLIMGMEKPTAGKIYFEGKDITDCSVTERARMGISYAFQQPVRFKGLLVRDLLEIADSKNKKLRNACDILSEVGLCAKDYRNRELNDTLSGGEMKRIEIAMTAARGTKLSLFDEPEAGIDLWSFQSLIHIFEELHEKTNGSILIISHQERILEIADKILYLKDGQIESYAEGKQVWSELKDSLQEARCARLDR